MCQWLSSPAWWVIGIFLLVVFGIDSAMRTWRANEWRRRRDDDDDPPFAA